MTFCKQLLVACYPITHGGVGADADDDDVAVVIAVVAVAAVVLVVALLVVQTAVGAREVGLKTCKELFNSVLSHSLK